MKKLFLIPLMIVLVSALIFGGCATPAPAPAPAPPTPPSPAPPTYAIELDLVTFLPTFLSTVEPAGWFRDWVNERSKGELTVKWVGGPEVIPGINQPEAVRTGTIDIGLFPSTFYESFVPEAYGITATEYAPWEERETGFYDYMVKVHNEKMGTYYLGRTEYNYPFYTSLNVHITKPQEIAGLKIAVGGGLGKPFLAALGAAPVFISDPETYSAVERGVVDGFVMPLDLAAEGSLYEITKYFVDYPYYTGNLVLLMNLDAWNTLPKHLQNLLIEVMTDLEKKVAVVEAEWAEAGRQKCLDNGMQPITFSPADAQWYIDLAYSSHWEAWREKLSPEAYDRLRELMIKK